MTVPAAVAPTPTFRPTPYVLDHRPVVPAVVEQVSAIAPAPKRRPGKGRRLLRMVLPYCLAAGVAGAVVTASGTALVLAGWEASRPFVAAVKPAHQQPDHLASVRAGLDSLSLDEVQTIQRQIEAAKRRGIGFAVEPAPLSSELDKEVTLYWILNSDEVFRNLALHGQIYGGLIGPSRGYNRGLLEVPSAKAITSAAELQAFLAASLNGLNRRS